MNRAIRIRSDTRRLKFSSGEVSPSVVYSTKFQDVQRRVGQVLA